MTFHDKGPLGQKQSNQRGTTIEGHYFHWLHNWDMGHGQCVLTARWDIELAHTSDVSGGKGMSYKGPLRHILSISRPLHLLEERTRSTFWPNVGFPGNKRLEWAERLFEIFQKGEDPTALFQDMQALANRDFLTEVLSKDGRIK